MDYTIETLEARDELHGPIALRHTFDQLIRDFEKDGLLHAGLAIAPKVSNSVDGQFFIQSSLTPKGQLALVHLKLGYVWNLKTGAVDKGQTWRFYFIRATRRQVDASEIERCAKLPSPEYDRVKQRLMLYKLRAERRGKSYFYSPPAPEAD